MVSRELVNSPQRRGRPAAFSAGTKKGSAQVAISSRLIAGRHRVGFHECTHECTHSISQLKEPLCESTLHLFAALSPPAGRAAPNDGVPRTHRKHCAQNAELIHQPSAGK